MQGPCGMDNRAKLRLSDSRDGGDVGVRLLLFLMAICVRWPYRHMLRRSSMEDNPMDTKFGSAVFIDFENVALPSSHDYRADVRGLIVRLMRHGPLIDGTASRPLCVRWCR